MIERLRAIAGGAAVREPVPGDDVHGVMAAAVVSPDGADACAATLAACSEHGWSVEVAGGRTARAAGRPVERVDVLLSTTRMSGIVEYEPDDLTIGVAGGTTLAELRARVATNRQRVPLDAPSDRATVGGTLARAVAGPMRQAWTTPRRQTLGLEVVTGDGRILRVGGRVVKNVAGYDLNKLLVGSAGTLGVVTRAHLRLLSIPDVTATLSIEANDVQSLLGVAGELLLAPIQPAAIEIAGSPWRLVVRYEGAEPAVAAGLETVTAAVRALGATPMRDDGALARIAVLECDAAVVVRIADLPTRLEATIERAGRIANGRGTIAAHAGAGIVRLLFTPDHAASLDVAAFARTIGNARAANGATVVVERGPAALMRALDPWGTLPDTVMALTLALKRQFDPAGILQRGRWIV